MTDEPRPLNQSEYDDMENGHLRDLEWFHLEAALISDWWNPSEEDKKQWKFIVKLNIDGSLMRKFLLDLGRHQGKSVHKFFRWHLSEAWPNKPDHRNSKRRMRYRLRYNKWGCDF